MAHVSEKSHNSLLQVMDVIVSRQHPNILRFHGSCKRQVERNGQDVVEMLLLTDLYVGGGLQVSRPDSVCCVCSLSLRLSRRNQSVMPCRNAAAHRLVRWPQTVDFLCDCEMVYTVACVCNTNAQVRLALADSVNAYFTDRIHHIHTEENKVLAGKDYIHFSGNVVQSLCESSTYRLRQAHRERDEVTVVMRILSASV